MVIRAKPFFCFVTATRQMRAIALGNTYINQEIGEVTKHEKK